MTDDDLHHLNVEDTSQKIMRRAAHYKTPFKVSKEEALIQLKAKMGKPGNIVDIPKRAGIGIYKIIIHW